jgi:hypothetical protein
MPEWIILTFILYLIYLVMNTPKTPTEKPVIQPKAEKPEAKAKVEKPAAKAKAEKSVATSKPAAAEAKPKKPSPAAPKAPKKAQPAAPNAAVEATLEIPMPERVGLTAGSIWNYLSQNGSTPVAKLVTELTEEERIIQRSIGWLAQEGKITLHLDERIEIISLK